MSESGTVAVPQPAASRTRLVAARVLTVIAVLLAVVSVVANFFIIALVALVGLWLSGPGPRPTAARGWLSPHLRRPEIAYTALIVGYLLLLWWQPTPQFGFLRNVIVWFLLAVLGLEVLRRQTTREFPEAEQADLVAGARGAFTRARERRAPWPPQSAAADQLATLAHVHDDGSLDDAEFAIAKAQLLGAGG